MLTLFLAIRSEESRAYVAFAGCARRILAEGVMKASEIWKIRHIFHQSLYACREGLLCLFAATLKFQVYLLRNSDEDLDQMCNVAASVIDVGLQQHAIAGSFV